MRNFFLTIILFMTEISLIYGRDYTVELGEITEIHSKVFRPSGAPVGITQVLNDESIAIREVSKNDYLKVKLIIEAQGEFLYKIKQVNCLIGEKQVDCDYPDAFVYANTAHNNTLYLCFYEIPRELSRHIDLSGDIEIIEGDIEYIDIPFIDKEDFVVEHPLLNNNITFRILNYDRKSSFLDLSVSGNSQYLVGYEFVIKDKSGTRSTGAKGHLSAENKIYVPDFSSEKSASGILMLRFKLLTNPKSLLKKFEFKDIDF